LLKPEKEKQTTLLDTQAKESPNKAAIITSVVNPEEE
jgi:hypothetical protein